MRVDWSPALPHWSPWRAVSAAIAHTPPSPFLSLESKAYIYSPLILFPNIFYPTCAWPFPPHSSPFFSSPFPHLFPRLQRQILRTLSPFFGPTSGRYKKKTYPGKKPKKSSSYNVISCVLNTFWAPSKEPVYWKIWCNGLAGERKIRRLVKGGHPQF